jgi:hypothetical protein
MLKVGVAEQPGMAVGRSEFVAVDSGAFQPQDLEATATCATATAGVVIVIFIVTITVLVVVRSQVVVVAVVVSSSILASFLSPR